MKKMKNVITKLLLTSLVFTGIFVPGRSFASNEIRSNKLSKIETQRSMVLKQVKDLLEKSGDIHLYEQAKRDIDNIFYKNIEHGFSLFGNGSLDNPNTGYGTVYMPKGGVAAFTILDGRMEVMNTYISREEALRATKSGVLSEMYSSGLGNLAADIASIRKVKNVAGKFGIVLKYVLELANISNKIIADELRANNDISLYITSVYDNKEMASSNSFVPWESYPFVDIIDAQYYRVLK